MWEIIKRAIKYIAPGLIFEGVVELFRTTSELKAEEKEQEAFMLEMKNAVKEEILEELCKRKG